MHVTAASPACSMHVGPVTPIHARPWLEFTKLGCLPAASAQPVHRTCNPVLVGRHHGKCTWSEQASSASLSRGACRRQQSCQQPADKQAWPSAHNSADRASTCPLMKPQPCPSAFTSRLRQAPAMSVKAHQPQKPAASLLRTAQAAVLSRLPRPPFWRQRQQEQPAPVPPALDTLQTPGQRSGHNHQQSGTAFQQLAAQPYSFLPAAPPPPSTAQQPAASQHKGLPANWAVQREEDGFVVVGAEECMSSPRHRSSEGASSSSAGAPAAAFDLRFTKHMTVTMNGCAAPSSRMESLAWLLFEARRLQAVTLGPLQPHQPSSWLSSPAATLLLEQIYMLGAGVAEVGTADSLQPLSNSSRAITALDYARLLERYLQAHGCLLTEAFVAGLPSDELQARALHVGALLETRCAVHRLIFERLIEHVGLEGGRGIAAGAITNTTVLTSTHASSSAAHATVEGQDTRQQGSGVGAGLVAVGAGIVTVAAGVVRWIVAVLLFVRQLVAKLLLLRTALAVKQAATAVSAAQQQQAPAVEALGASGKQQGPLFNTPGADSLQATVGKSGVPGAQMGPLQHLVAGFQQKEQQPAQEQQQQWRLA